MFLRAEGFALDFFLMKIVIALLGAFLSLALLGGCSSQEGESSYSIGAILPLRGECSEASREIVRGMEIARDEINARGGVAGVPLRLDVRDARADKGSVLETFDVMRRGGVKVFNMGFGKEVIFTKNIISKCDDVFVNYLCSYPPITLDMPNSTRVFINGAQMGDIMAAAVKRGGAADVNIVAMNVDNFFGKADADYLAFNLKVSKTKYYRDVFGEGETRFGIFAEQIGRLYADYVFYVGHGAELGAFLDSLAKAGYSKTVVANCPLEPVSVSVPKGIEFYQVETFFEQGKIDTEVSRRFKAAYEAKFGARPSWRAACGYDSIMLLAQAAQKSRFIPSKMRAHFENLRHGGALGKIEFDKTADSTLEMSLVRK